MALSQNFVKFVQTSPKKKFFDFSILPIVKILFVE